MYYGHFIESYMKAGSAIAAVHYKFIYSFHMPLFFILSGYVAKEQLFQKPFVSYLGKLAVSRLIPYLFFSFLLIIPTIWTTDNTVGLDLNTTQGYVKGIAFTLFAGFPFFNIPTWFLICLFVVELIHFYVSPHLTSNKRVLLIALGFYIAGATLAWNAPLLNPMNALSPHGMLYPYFMSLEAITAYAFFLMGVWLRRVKILQLKLPAYQCCAAALAGLAIVYFTFDLNKGMFTVPNYDAVILVASSHGNLILFPLTALIGSMAIILLAKISTERRFLVGLGQNAIIIFGLNGIFYHLINDRLATGLLALLSGSHISILLSGIVVTFISILLTLPFVYLFNRYLPQLTGKPKMMGPILPRLVS